MSELVGGLIYLLAFAVAASICFYGQWRVRKYGHRTRL